MGLRFTSFFVAALAFASITNGGENNEPDSKVQSSVLQVATEIDQYQTNTRSLDRKLMAAVNGLRQAYLTERAELLRALSERLASEQKFLTKKGELDQAVAVRDQIKQLESIKVVDPLAKLDQSRGLSPTPEGILGTWRWNNGVDIRNLPGGQTNGNGAWRLVDSEKQIYHFEWKKLAPDQVRLSPNGRVLEGTKLKDRGFRVWAVRID